MAIKEKPAVRPFGGGVMWEHTFETFHAKVVVPHADESAKIINYGYDAPCFLFLVDAPLSDEDAVQTAKTTGLFAIAQAKKCSVVFINPLHKGGWQTAPDGIFEEIIANTKIHQYYTDGIAILNNRFFKTNDGFAIRGAIFRSCVIASGNAADYVATHLLCAIEGEGLWGKADICPTVCVLQGLSVMPKIERRDMPIVSVNNSLQINDFIARNTDYSFIVDGDAAKIDDGSCVPLCGDLTHAYDSFIKKFIRWGWHGELSIEDDLQKLGIAEEPCICSLATSADNKGDDTGTKTHEVGYICYYNKALLARGEPLPLVLCFHGGGDSAKHIAKVSNWVKVCHDHDFLLVCVENHMNSTATEMMELLDVLKARFNIDSTRIYATGFSMGGCKTWDLYQEYPRIFAGVAPMDATVDVGQNFHGNPSRGMAGTGEINKSECVPLFYAGGEETPLPELPFQAQKCFDRAGYVLGVNDCVARYEKHGIGFENQSEWQNKIWGISGDKTEKLTDASRNAVLTIEYFKSRDGNTYTAFASIDNQGHECRHHTCEAAYKFLSRFSRVNGKIVIEK